MIAHLIKLFFKLFFFTGRIERGKAFLKPLSPEEEKKCFLKARNGDKEAEEKLVSHNLRLVAHIVKKYGKCGYETDELKDIGFFPAKIDDILNYIPARLSGLFVIFAAYLLRLDGRNAYKIMRRDARKCPSPNSGYTMATTAGALNIQLIKKDTYILGDDNKDITKDDISKAVKLSKLTMILFTITIILLFTLIYVIL